MKPVSNKLSKFFKRGILVVFLSLMGITHGQSNDDQDSSVETSEEIGLLGKVKAVEAYIYQLPTGFSGDGELQSITEVHFNEEGYMNRKSLKNPEGNLREEWTYHYDPQNNLVEQKEHKTTPNSVTYTKTAEFDEEGNMVSGTSYNPDGSIAVKRTLIYDEKGNKTKVEDALLNDNSSRKWIYQYDGSGNRIEQKLLIGDRTFEVVKFRFNEAGEEVEKEVYRDEDQWLDTRTFYSYDEEGRLVKEKEISYDPDGSEGAEMIRETIFEDDQKIGVVEEYSETKGNRWYKRETKFDNQGNPTSEKNEHSSAVLSYERSHNYKFDQKGNWTLKESVTEGGGSTVVERKIEYYP